MEDLSVDYWVNNEANNEWEEMMKKVAHFHDNSISLKIMVTTWVIELP